MEIDRAMEWLNHRCHWMSLAISWQVIEFSAFLHLRSIWASLSDEAKKKWTSHDQCAPTLRILRIFYWLLLDVLCHFDRDASYVGDWMPAQEVDF